MTTTPIKHMKSWNYILLLFLLPAIYSCSERKIEIGYIETRAQLDSILTLLPADSIQVDSLKNRTLSIRLQGNLSAFGVPLRYASFTLVNEELDQLNIYNIPKGALTLLNNIEAEYGLANYKGSDFSWDLPRRKLSFEANSQQFFKTIQPIDIRDTLSSKLDITYYSFVKNKITDIASEFKPSADYVSYKMHLRIYSSIEYNLWLNDFPILDEDDAQLNIMLPARGKQSVTLEFLPSPSLTQMREDLSNERSSASLQILESTQHADREINISLTSDMFVAGKKNTITFDLLDIPYRLDYLNGQDLRTVDGLKEKIYSHYQLLQKAYSSKNEKQLCELLYPLQKQSAIALNRSEKDIQELWSLERLIFDNNEGFDLMNIDELKLEFAYKGKLARLVPIAKKEYEFALTAYVMNRKPFSLAYYVFIDNTNNLNFAIE